ncbi:MAG: PIG-L family deacetylase [Candidatus Thermoplasmatota archaeon]|nr:PIG-L family deacetylase [Candidatus Thermoplasmatota archaeon]
MCEIGENDLRKSAIIFSPHPDDETLGCGGTIIKKKRFDADVSIVILTDGSQSHSAFISRDELKFMRARNALAATHVLGVDENDVFFLEFENRKLYENFNSAVQKVKEILMDLQPEEIFIPYYKEPLFWSTDHLATTKVVLSALALSGLNTVINEYPIGFWGHWPWTSTLLQDVWKKSLYAWTSYLFSGLYMLKDFRFFVQINDVLEIKRAALFKYKTQMTRLFSNLNWPILEDVSNGEFLKCFFQDREVFRRYSFVKPAFIN